jgi:hypothetical protein
MRHDFARFEQAAFWVHVVIACVLLGYLICRKNPAIGEWIALGQQPLKIEFFSDALLPESTPNHR